MNESPYVPEEYFLSMGLFVYSFVCGLIWNAATCLSERPAQLKKYSLAYFAPVCLDCCLCLKTQAQTTLQSISQRRESKCALDIFQLPVKAISCGDNEGRAPVVHRRRIDSSSYSLWNSQRKSSSSKVWPFRTTAVTAVTTLVFFSAGGERIIFFHMVNNLSGLPSSY